MVGEKHIRKADFKKHGGEEQYKIFGMEQHLWIFG